MTFTSIVRKLDSKDSDMMERIIANSTSRCPFDVISITRQIHPRSEEALVTKRVSFPRVCRWHIGASKNVLERYSN